MNGFLCRVSRVGGKATVTLALCRAALNRSASQDCDVYLGRLEHNHARSR
jgi:hypothetical protein